MSTKSKFAAALAVLHAFERFEALRQATTVALPVSQAQARHRGWGLGAAVLGSAIVAGAIANSAHGAYDDPYGYRWHLRPAGQRFQSNGESSGRWLKL